MTVHRPADVLRRVLADRGLTQAQLAERMGRDRPYVSRVCSGAYPIGPRFALDLERVLGTPEAEYWVSLQGDWYLHVERQRLAEGAT